LLINHPIQHGALVGDGSLCLNNIVGDQLVIIYSHFFIVHEKGSGKYVMTCPSIQILSMEINMWKKGLGIFRFSAEISICNTHANSQDDLSSKLTSKNTIWLQNTKKPNCTHMVAWRFGTIFDNSPRSKILSTNLKQIEPLNWTFLHIKKTLWSTTNMSKGIGPDW
jgi:hypothetical protein